MFTAIRILFIRLIDLIPQIPKTGRIRRKAVRTLVVKHPGVPDQVTPVIVLSAARSGSTLLMQLMSSHWKSLKNFGEILNPKVHGPRSFEEALRHSYFTYSGQQFTSVKVLMRQVSDEHLAELLALPRMHVIILRRGNLIRQFVSRAIAERDGFWVQPPNIERSDVSARVVDVNIDDLLVYEQELETHFRRFAKLSEGLPVLHVTYEDMLDDRPRELLRIGDFLGAGPPAEFRPTNMKHQNPEPLAQLIRNLDEVRKSLQALGRNDLIEQLDA